MKKIAIVTGGASGLGYCISEELLKHGIEVLMVGRREERLASAQEAFRKTYDTPVSYVCGSISEEGFVKNLYQKLAEEGVEIQYLINCAGTGKFGPAEENTREMIDVAFDASLIGLILMSSAALPSMKEHGGYIVNIMSTAALRGKPNETVYCAAKWGARGFTEALKEAVKGGNVKVIGVYPGGMNTEFWSPECGMDLDASKLMNPVDVADVIVHGILERGNMYMSDITIDRK